MKKIIFVLFLFSISFFSCKEKSDVFNDVEFAGDTIRLPYSHFYHCHMTTDVMPNYKSIEFLAYSDANELNFAVSKIQMPDFYGLTEDDYLDMITKDLIKANIIEESKKNSTNNYVWQYTRSREDSKKKYLFVLYIEDTTLGILSASSSNVIYKVVGHK
ncbi:MAG: hypothetical protein J6V90_01970 [Treponema sp.]|nr:hypothetical protein [Treponema sp.]